ncbi:hypothetical protein DRO60_06265 [Candidatus Bathyarchaeota archaeon]|nr:MAG: hypothetical protein DRO60_06265 [Candidatus Bathyarchaeota archaeon]
MPKVKRSVKQAAGALSVLLFFVVVFLGLANYGFWDPMFHQILNLALILAILPVTVLDAMDFRWRSSIDKALPRFLEGIAHAQLTGLTLLKAFKEAGEGITGPLRDEVRLMMAKISWGMEFEDALRFFMKRADTPLARRVAMLIIEANRSGGVVERIFTPLARATSTFQTMEEERKAQLKPYVLITYISFVIFLVIVYVLYTSFFLPLVELTAMGGFSAVVLPVGLSWMLLYHMSFVLGTFSGLIAGVLSEGRAMGGLKHVIIMLTMAFFVFREMVAPGWLWGLLGLA